MQRFVQACFLVAFFALTFVVPQTYAQYDNTSTVLGQFNAYTSTTAVSTTGYAQSIPPTNAYNFDINLGKIAYDSTRHRLFVADNNNNRILVYDTGSSDVIPFGEAPDYVLGQADFNSNTAATSQSGLSGPQGLTLDETNGRLYVADNNNCRIMIYDVSGTITTNMNASNYLGGGASFNAATCASTSYETTNLNQFRSPADVAFDPDTNFLYVVDTTKRRITIFDVASITNGETATSVVLGDSTGNFSLSSPRGLEVDTTNNRLFVGDGGKNRVLVYDIAALVSLEDPVNVLGQPDFATTTAGVTQAKLFGAFDTAFKSSTNQLAVGSNGRVTIYDVASISNGENAAFVLGQADFTAASSSIDISTTGNVPGLAWLGSDRLLVLDTSRLLSFNITTITDGEAATNVLGQVDPFGTIKTDTRTADGIFRTAYGMSAPKDVATDVTNNRLFVADKGNNRILVFNLDSTTKLPSNNQADYVLGASDFTTAGTAAATNSTFRPAGLELDVANNRLFVADDSSHRVLIFDVSSISNGEAAANVIGHADFTTTGSGTTDSTFNFPAHITYDSTNQWLFVGDGSNYRIMVFDISGGISNGMTASKVLGQPDFTTVNCNLTINGMCDADGQLDFDQTNRRLYVVDPTNNRILVYTIPSTLASFNNGMDASYVIGQSSFTTSDFTPVTTRFNNAGGVALTSSGMLLVQDCFNYRILAYDVTSLANDPTPIGVLGQTNFTNVTELGITANTFDCAWGQGIEFDSTSQRLYLADDARSRVLGIDFANITTTSLANGVVGTAYSQALSSSQLNATGTFTVQSGTLPAGLSLSSSNITGTPTAAASASLTFRLADDGGGIGYFFTTKALTLTVTASQTPAPTATPSPSPTPTPTATPTPSPVTAGAATPISPTGGGVSSLPAFSWKNPAEPQNLGGYKIIVDGVDFFGTLPIMSIETTDYILVYDSSAQTFLLQSKKTISTGEHSWYVISVSTTGRETDSASVTFTVGGSSTDTTKTDEGIPEEEEGIGDDEETASAAAGVVDGAPLASGAPLPNLPEFRSLFGNPGDILGTVVQYATPVITAAEKVAEAVNEVAKPVAPIVPAAASVVAPVAAAAVALAQTGTGTVTTNILSKLLQALGLIGQGKPQGMIYDSLTHVPIPFALLTFTNQDKSIQETAVTDVNGVYRGIKLSPGVYTVTANHQDFSFPAKKGRPNYLSQRDYYQGSPFTVTSAKTEQLFMIPMDNKVKGASKKSLWMKIKLTLKRALLHKTEVTFIFFVFSLYMTWLHPSWLNMALASFYGLVLAYLGIQSLQQPLVVGVVNGPKGKPLGAAIIKFILPQLNQLVAVVTSDSKGAFKAFVEKGKYQMMAVKPGYVWNQGKDVMSFNELNLNKQQKIKLQFDSPNDIYTELFGADAVSTQSPPL